MFNIDSLVMAKGDYSSKWGGSRNGYEKGKKDANDSMINKVIDIIGKIADAFFEARKKR
ncbi:hypothetical protein [Algoriphagus yeomjeoni]|uniref:Uncharacterized protein n=1 Tax=Algoriphagus yeomjeoni TaxID=291403 RepID=A0A327NYF5_9BACT|nr:hypothetical protein [Algoriphagus yeomjeoni]RAI84187.1 hypothetical protein LV83_04080 [Algoriphagus yeomjeoni]